MWHNYIKVIGNSYIRPKHVFHDSIYDYVASHLGHPWLHDYVVD
jgi:hypothetical protein